MHGALASVIDESWGSLGERRFLLLTLIGFVGAFGFIRLSTRLMRSPRVPWWPGSVVSDSGVHMHHLFFGIVLMMVAGVLSFAAGETDGPWYAVYALLFGVGFGPAIDEYALWLHLDDVYWSREGRSSIDAALVALALIGFVLLAFVPTTDRRRLVRIAGHHGHAGDVALRLGADRRREAPARARADGHRSSPFLPLYAALRLAKPGSIWARRFYGERRPDKRRAPSTGSAQGA